ncbi:MAG TPA: Ger(x)C family spore germination protein [Mobilitalea sp.]|nr:Ger(x)C family spore germination protein [Mobilitalea sp.]
MKRRLLKTRKYACLFLLSFLPLVLSGCTHDISRREIDELDLVLVLGIDYSNGEYTLTAITNGSGGSSGGGSGQQKGSGSSGGSSSGTEQVAEGKGKTAYEALQDLMQKDKKAITLAQTGSFLIGEGAAKQGLDQSLDFLSRDETIKMEALIYTIKEMTAADFIKTGMENKQTIHTDLDAMKQKQQELLTRNDNTVVNILNDMRQSYSCVLIPYLIADKSGYLIEGYTVFDKLKQKDYLDHETSDGVSFFRNIMRTYPIYLQDQVSLWVSFTNTNLKAKVKDNQITVTVKVSFDSMVKEVLTKDNIFNLTEMNRLTEAQNSYIQAILEKPANYSIKNDLDILNLARLIENQNYSQWKDIRDNWTDEISKIKYEYKLQSRISKSFILGQE